MKSYFRCRLVLWGLLIAIFTGCYQTEKSSEGVFLRTNRITGSSCLIFISKDWQDRYYELVKTSLEPCDR